MDALPRPSLKARADINASIALARFFIVAVSWSRVSARTIEKKIKKCLRGRTGYGILRVARQIRSSPGGVESKFAERKLTRVIWKGTKELWLRSPAFD